MAKLIAKSPAEGLLPVEVGDSRLDEMHHEAITWVAPLDGHEAVLAFAFPAPDRMTGGGGRRALWSGSGQALVLGPPLHPEGAAVADQSSAWAVLALSGPAARDVLARLTPLDLRDAVFPEGASARTLLGHMTAGICRTGPETYEIMVFRSMTRTAVHEIARAMKGIAGRAAL